MCRQDFRPDDNIAVRKKFLTAREKKSKSKIKKEEYSDELVQEVREAFEDYKNGRYFKGTAEEVIKHLRDEANRVKKL